MVNDYHHHGRGRGLLACHDLFSLERVILNKVRLYDHVAIFERV